MKQKFIRLLNQIRGFFPEAIPNGMQEFDSWITSFVNTYDLPTKNVETVKFIITTTIINLQDKTIYKNVFKPKFYFYLVVKAAAAKEIAGAIFTDLKTAQQARFKAEQQKSAEATANKLVASNGSNST